MTIKVAGGARPGPLSAVAPHQPHEGKPKFHF